MVAKVRRRSAAGPTIKKRAAENPEITHLRISKKLNQTLTRKKRLFASLKDLAKGTRVVLCGP